MVNVTGLPGLDADRIIVQPGGEVLRDGAELTLPPRERELVCALAAQSRPVSRETLGRLLHPDRDRADAANHVKVYVYRLRQRVAPGFVLLRHGEYVLGPHVRNEIATAREALASRLGRNGAFTRAQRDELIALAERLRREPPPSLSDREWYEPVARRQQRLGRDLALAVARDALADEADGQATRVGLELTAEDACDEEAWELLIRVYLRVGNHAAALQGFRLYEQTVALELHGSPSLHVRRLVADGCGCALPATG